jgi:hypothetical protein
MKTIHVRRNKFDDLNTCLGHNLLKWSQAFYLSSRLNFEYKIVLKESEWPELKFLKLPNTIIRKSLDFKNIKEINHDNYYEIFKNVLVDNSTEIIQTSDNWCITDLFFDKIFYYHDQYNLKKSFNIEQSFENPFDKIKFKKKEINDFFDNEFSNFVGIHIRRFYGVLIKTSDIETLPSEIRETFLKNYLDASISYLELFKTSVYNKQEFINDIEYYKFIDEVLDFDINQNFFISTDIPILYYRYYKERYRNIYDKYYYTDRFENIIRNHYSEQDVETYRLVLYTLFDLFALSRTKLIARNNKSCWGKVAKRMKNKQDIVIPLDLNNSQINVPLKIAYKGKLRYSEIF